MMAHLNNAGWKSAGNTAEDAKEADLIIVNSCGFIESAKQESINAVLEWRKLYPQKKILLAGCLAQRYAKDLREILPEADGFFGVENIEGITDATKEFLPQRTRRAQRGVSTGERPLLSLPGSAYVKISEGCSNNCSYCAIPIIRGGLVSRTIQDILEECKALLKRGIAELILIAQDTGSFGTDTAPYSMLPQVLEEISKLKGHFWVRLLYIHPDHFPYEILDIMQNDPRLLPYFDIPFQHASPKILSAMNRKGTSQEYLELLAKIRKKLSHAVIRSTFLLGFPGETEEDFAALLDFQQKAALDWIGCFTYSKEEGTAAYSMKNSVPAKTATKRKQIIEEHQIPITEKNMERFINQELEVLIEEEISGDDDSAFYLGRLYCQAPEIDGAAVIAGSTLNGKKPQLGILTPCKVIGRRGFDLEVCML